MQSIAVELAIQDYWAEMPAHSSVVPISTWETWFQNWLVALNPTLSPIQTYELGLRLTDNVEIQALNREYRDRDQSTDVLAFAALEVDTPASSALLATEPLYLGDIVISIEMAHHQAAERNHPLETELAWLAAHGLLHLLGWDHPDESSLERMLAQQSQLLRGLGISIEFDDPVAQTPTV
jgi:probable rRNA maturation factor